MARLLIHVEGQAEESFVNEVLADHLYPRGYDKVAARLVGNARLRERRGGIRAWSTVRRDILNHLKEDPNCLATTMVDYYGLPRGSKDHGWPGRDAAGRLPFGEKAECVEQAIADDLKVHLSPDEVQKRFLPFVMMHEFEGLLFSDCVTFARAIGKPSVSAEFQKIRDQFRTPEEINDSAATAPSKRVERLVAGYEKPFHGTLAALEIGIESIRAQCPHFEHWLDKLESWPAHAGGT